MRAKTWNRVGTRCAQAAKGQSRSPTRGDEGDDREKDMFDYMDEQGEQHKIGLLDLLVVVLSIYVLFALIADTFFHLDSDTSKLLQLIDNGICFFFLIDFIIRFVRANNKLEFMKWGWIDLLASIPTVDALRAGRAFRLFRVLRVLRLFRSARHLAKHVYRNRAYGTFTTVAIIAVLLVLTSL